MAETASPADVWRDRAVFITGANGFVGSWVAARLVQAGARVVALVRDQVPEGGLQLQNLEGRLTVITGDLADLPLLHRVLAEHEIQDCFHLAAQAIVGAADRSPVSTFASNTMGTVNLFEACRLAGVDRIVLASTDKAYGSAATLPYREDMRLLGKGPYEASKVAAEVVATSYAHTYGVRVAVARCANVYGGGDLNFSRLIPDSVQKVVRGIPPVLRSDGTPRRDYIHASDAAEAYLALGVHCRSRLAESAVESFNFGTGVGVSTIDLVRMILVQAGRADLEPEIHGIGVPSREIQDQYLDSTKAHLTLGWEPTITLPDGLASTLDWYTDYFRSRAGRSALDQSRT